MTPTKPLPPSTHAGDLTRMTDLMVALTSVAVFGGILWGLVRVAVLARRSGGRGGSLMQPFDEIWHPMAHQSRVEVEVQQEHPAPSPLPGDRPHRTS